MPLFSEQLSEDQVHPDQSISCTFSYRKFREQWGNSHEHSRGDSVDDSTQRHLSFVDAFVGIFVYTFVSVFVSTFVRVFVGQISFSPALCLSELEKSLSPLLPCSPPNLK